MDKSKNLLILIIIIIIVILILLFSNKKKEFFNNCKLQNIYYSGWGYYYYGDYGSNDPGYSGDVLKVIDSNNCKCSRCCNGICEQEGLGFKKKC